MTAVMSSFVPTDSEADFLSTDEMATQILTPFYQELPSTSSLPSSSHMDSILTSVPFGPFPPLAAFASQSPQFGIVPSMPLQHGLSFWANTDIPTFQQQAWLPMPSCSSSMAALTSQAPIQDVPTGFIPSDQTRTQRSQSFASVASLATTVSSPEPSPSEFSRASSPGHADLNMYGFLNPEGTWSCAYPGCTSRAVFTRGCDLRKHHKRHTKSFFCRYPNCSQAAGGGFSSKKDLARHEAKHNPGVVCEWDGCDRIFSRVDNMRDHVKRIHLKNRRSSASKAVPSSSI